MIKKNSNVLKGAQVTWKLSKVNQMKLTFHGMTPNGVLTDVSLS